eukprot:1161704-Pelagomonas_calceolata.AAC.11
MYPQPAMASHHMKSIHCQPLHARSKLVHLCQSIRGMKRPKRKEEGEEKERLCMRWLHAMRESSHGSYQKYCPRNSLPAHSGSA